VVILLYTKFKPERIDMLTSLPLKDYQRGVLDALDAYLTTLGECHQEAKDFYEFKVSNNKSGAIHPKKSSYCHDAWEKAKSRIHIPRYRNKKGQNIPNIWQNRMDGKGQYIPNICMKVPTGGGKTLMAACALGRISRDYFKKSKGLVLWIVPSTTIYKQTLKALYNKEHPYRKQLDMETGGCVKILERGDALHKMDVENNLCIMVLMLQSFNVSKGSKDARKVYSDSGKYMSFFPEVDDYVANNQLINEIQNIEEEDMLARDVITGITIKQSLGNVFRLCRPIVIIDEEHKAKSPKAIDNINEFNPSFILEFSATPREGSNKLVDVGGQALKEEQMIKLPINVQAAPKADWKTTLNEAHAKLKSLAKDAATLEGRDGTYIRPIMVIIAEPKRQGEDYDHVEEIKKYLIDKCQVLEQQIKIKLSGTDEIGDEDLLNDKSSVRYIITKDALREGWDCSFAYVLTILAQKESQTALTQYTGRVLRQPYGEITSIQSLNESYIFCTKINVGDAITKIKEGLESEGMGDIANEIQNTDDNANSNERAKVTIKRYKKFEKKIFLPSLTARKSGGDFQKFDYYRDVLEEIDWSNYTCSKNPTLADNRNARASDASIDFVDDLFGQQELGYTFGSHTSIRQDHAINHIALTAQLTDKIPNSFEASRIFNEIINKLIKNGYEEPIIAASGHELVKQIKDDAFDWLLDKSEKLFVDKLNKNEIVLKLHASPLSDLNWDMEEERTVYKGKFEDKAIGWDKNLFQPQYKSNYNALELEVASYINHSEAIKWWHRLGVRGTEYHVQGWKKDKIYPDFLILSKNDKYIFLETKGNHLENPDSAYKQKVFEYFAEHANKTVGEFKLLIGEKEIEFDLIYENHWKEKLNEKDI
jgi:type III restriction enzyme